MLYFLFILLLAGPYAGFGTWCFLGDAVATAILVCYVGAHVGFEANVAQWCRLERDVSEGMWD